MFLAQMEEHQPSKLLATGSNPVKHKTLFLYV